MLFSTFARDIRVADDRLRHLASRVTWTNLGPIEHVEAGVGPPVLSIHGVVGGCDHGLGIAGSYLGDGFQVISMSRFGYLRSPVPADSTPAAQADLFAALLDTLGIARAGILATSAGTAPALQFALRHPERCTALALFSLAVPPYPPVPGLMRAMMRVFFKSDVLWWTAGRYTPLVRRLMGIHRGLEGHLSPADQAYTSDLFQSFLPIHVRGKGVMNDVTITNPDLNTGYPLDRLTVPALVCHARDDTWGAFDGCRRMVAPIPKLQFVPVESGGHLLLGHRDDVRACIAGFLHQHAGALTAG